MKRRLPDSGSVPIPAEVEAGPDVRVWATAEELKALQRMPSGGDPFGGAMYHPWLRWLAARRAWANGAGIAGAEADRLVPVRGPFMGERPAV